MPDDTEDDERDADAPSGGTPFYMTPNGHAALVEEGRRLWSDERPKVVELVAWAAGLGDRSENADYQYGKRRLREIDRRVRFLRQRLARAQVVDPAKPPRPDRVFFGAIVTYVREDDTEATVRIVGIDEADGAKGSIAWVSPVARALLRAQVGDVVRARTPAGVEALEVVAIRYGDG